jgi:hypothetical protein
MGAAGQRAQTGDQLGEGERLGHVVVGAEREPVDQVVDAGGGGQHKHAAVGLLPAQRATDVVAVHHRQVAVEHHHVVGVQARLVERAGAVVGNVDRHALAPQPARDRIGDPSLVFGHQHAHPVQGSERPAPFRRRVMRR